MNGNPLGENTDDIVGLMSWLEFEANELWMEQELARRYVEGALENLWDQAYSSIGAMHGPQHFDVLAARDILRKCHEEILKDIK